MTKTFALAISLFALTAPAFAGQQCQDDIAKIDKAMDQAEPDQKQEVFDLREQAVQLCGAGNDEAGLDVIAQAKTILNIE